MNGKRLAKDAMKVRDKIFDLVEGFPTDVVIAALILTEVATFIRNKRFE